VALSNWGTASDPNFKGYHNGNNDPRGYGTCSEVFSFKLSSIPKPVAMKNLA